MESLSNLSLKGENNSGGKMWLSRLEIIENQPEIQKINKNFTAEFCAKLCKLEPKDFRKNLRESVINVFLSDFQKQVNKENRNEILKKIEKLQILFLLPGKTFGWELAKMIIAQISAVK